MQNRSIDMGEVYFALCKSIDSPQSLGCWLRYKHGEIRALAELEIEPADYLTSAAFRKDYLVTSYLSKYKDLATGIDLKAVALRKFYDSEEECSQTNRRLRQCRASGVYPLGLSQVLSLASRKIARLLGPFSAFVALDGGGWGPGATTDIRRRSAALDTKIIQTPISCTPRAANLFLGVVRADLHWSAAILKLSPGDITTPFNFDRRTLALTDHNVVELVPKNAKTHRVIAKEPRANGFIQKAYGDFFRGRLKRVGIDLDDQGPNQDASRRAYEQDLATLDLRAASDSLATELVYELLPVDWAIALSDVRSPCSLLPDGRKVNLEKFSSMGNGYTFELETLVFWALMESVRDLTSCRGQVLVYGDDIVIPRAFVHEAITCLAFCGFQTNSSKSFWDGPFYESCGKHWFQGHDVTPIYQKETIERDGSLVRAANRIIRLATKWSRGWALAPELASAWYYLRDRAGATRSLRLPNGSDGDDGWLLPAVLWPATHWDRNFGFRCTVMSQLQRRLPAHSAALLAWTLRRGVHTESPFNDSVVFSSPETTKSYGVSHRWVIPTWEFGLDFTR